MKNFFIIIVLMSFVFVNCDGRKSKSEALKESIAKFKKNQSAVETVYYYPTEYTEVVTYTLISNKVNVYIKNYSLLNKSISISVEDHTNDTNKTEHRIFESEVLVSAPNKEILKMHISAEKFKSMYSDDFWNHATLQHVWVNQELSTSEDIQLDMSFINPSDHSFKLYRMSVDSHGKHQINLIEEQS